MFSHFHQEALNSNGKSAAILPLNPIGLQRLLRRKRTNRMMLNSRLNFMSCDSYELYMISIHGVEVIRNKNLRFLQWFSRIDEWDFIQLLKNIWTTKIIEYIKHSLIDIHPINVMTEWKLRRWRFSQQIINPSDTTNIRWYEFRKFNIQRINRNNWQFIVEISH